METFVQRQEPICGQDRAVREAQDTGPGRPRRMRHRHLRQQQGGIHRLRPGRAQHRRQDRSGRDIYGDVVAVVLD